MEEVRNRQLLNFVAVIDQDTWTKESWTDRGDVAEAIAAYEGWHPQLLGILQEVDDTFVWALFDRPPMRQWTVGRVTLLGDACHAMLPFMAQGAAQAIEDGATLAACLAKPSLKDVADGLKLYEAHRLPLRRACKHSRPIIRRGFTCPTGRSKSGATQKWQKA